MLFSGERISPTAAIASILNSYPFSVGLFRELLQNSDDAKASKQVFVLDHRQHPTESLYLPHLGSTQGPALLAYNDGVFSDQDWEAVQTIYESSKTADTSKIGKYGIGFRSCYHITDNPQILSGSTLALFDPHRSFTSSGGATIDFIKTPHLCHDHLSSFDLDFFRSESSHIGPLSGTIIRLPLRTTAGPAGRAGGSLIKNGVVEPDEVRQLLEDFIDGELDIVLLFLACVSSIEIYEVDDQGTRQLARAVLSKGPLDEPRASRGTVATFRATVSVDTEGSDPAERSWRMIHASFSETEAASALSDRIQQDASAILKKQKLSPNVSLAMPLGHLECSNRGRLFTYLPLPLQTGFPCHIHGLFALTPDRQHLRNSEETGLVPGSTDAVLVEWNRLLFDLFVPRTWASLLPVLLTADGIVDVFKLWPPVQPSVQGGDTIYWRSLPLGLLLTVVEDELPIWPTVDSAQNKYCAELRSVLVASGTEHAGLLPILARAGVRVTDPPAYVTDLLVQTGVEYTPLNPATLRHVLLANIPAMVKLEPSEVDHILIYLVSTKDLLNIVGLPVIRLVNGRYNSLHSSHDAEIHTLLHKEDCPPFRYLDDSDIALHELPPTVADLLFESGPLVLNVAPLTCERVVQYLSLITVLAEATSETVIHTWLILTWTWLAKWHARKALYASICDLPLVPTSYNTRISPRQTIFTGPDIDRDLRDVLESLGISFLHPNFKRICGALGEMGALRSSHIIHDILDQLEDGPFVLDSDAADVLREHINLCLPNSCLQKGPLNGGLRLKLLALPIYPTLVPPAVSTGNNHATIVLDAIPPDKKVVCVASMTLLPVIEGTVFVQNCFFLLKFARSDAELGELIKDDGVLALAIDYLADQPKHLQRAFVEYIINHRLGITLGLLDQLSHSPFVAVGDGSSRSAPVDVVDPDTKLAELLNEYNPVDARLPCVSLSDDVAIIRGLRKLQFLRTRLYDELVEEIICFISVTEDTDALAKRLLHLIVQSDYDCSGLNIKPGLHWLPTNEGMRGLEDCHHRDAHHPELFDRVLPCLDVPKLSSSLKIALHWNGLLPINIVTSQFAKVLEEHRLDRIVPIIKELGCRIYELTQSDLVDLLDLSRGQAWVPTSESRLVMASRAVFSSHSLPDGFFSIRRSLVNVAKIFLERMGCTEKPSLHALIDELHALSEGSCSPETTKKALVILEALLDTNLCEERTPILVPDVSNHLRPRSDLYYNDLGDRAYFIHLPDDCFMTHSKVDREFALRLKIRLLGLSELKPFNDDEDMCELLTNRISNVLLQYTVEQAFGELVSNAVDAGAKKFDVLLDEQTFGSSHILSPTLAVLHSLPALVIHNDATFTDRDFKGIRRIGKGGKDDRSDSIGQFGLGALSLYHFTEVVMILSGDKVMILDPSKKYLDIPGRASVLIPLSHIRRFYNDHLVPFDGLFGFSRSMDFYRGTLFRLSLRSAKQAETSDISAKSLTADDVGRLISNEYRDTARSSLLFTELDALSAERRDKAGSCHQLWSISGTRGVPSTDGDITSRTLRIVGNDSKKPSVETIWQLASQRTAHDHIPSKFEPLIDKHRLRDPVITGFAANLTTTQPISGFKGKLFSGLPLPGPISTSLPAHLNASFILSEDRRSVRFDGDGQVNLESQYNRWLLSDLGPPLYIFLLENLLNRHAQGSHDWWRWWPEARLGRDSMTSALVQSFYSQHLLDTNRRICLNIAGNDFLLPRDARLIGEDDFIIKLLRRFNPRDVIELPPAIQRALGGRITSVQSDYVRSVIAENADSIVDGYMKWLKLDDLIGILRFLLEGGVSTVIGLPLLPLASKQLVNLEHCHPGAKMYYTWMHLRHYPSLFPLNRFVTPKFPVKELPDDVNVSNFEDVAVRELVRDVIPECPRRCSVTVQEKKWISLLWTALATTGATPNSLKDFPLVATSQSKTYISLAHCLEPRVFISGPESTSLIFTLIGLGATIVPKAMCPPPVLAFFENRKKVTSIDLITILSFLDNVGGDTLQRFCQSHDEEYAKFAEWARAGVRDMPKRLLAPACRLPIWPNLCTGGTVSYVTAAAARVLPFKATPSIAMPFVSFESNIVAYSPALVNHLHVRPMGFSIFRDCLTIPSRLSEGNTHDYRRLLDLLISSRLEDPRDVVVPNALGSMVPSSTLYSRLNTLFLQAFQTRPEKLIHADFRHLESGLSGFGLKTQMSFASFKVCVTAIHEDVDGENRVQRARSLFSWYNNELPIHTAGDYTSWRELDNLRFIPRHEIRHRTMSLYMDTYARTLPDLVAPNEIVRPEFEAIAWTQRALFQQRPSERLLIADLSLGVPSVFEVVEHLRILAKRISPNFPSDVDILSDITKTYEWLESHKNDPHLRCLEQYKKECLFLNVDDAQSTEWRWHCAEQMFFCLRAPDPDNRFFGVGAFLSPFQGLLRCAGVKEIKNPARPKLTISSPESQLSQIRTNFNDMRNEGMLTDVVFTSDDDKQFPAHRVLLATQTDYFRDQFSKNWDTGSVARDTHAIRMVGYNGSTLEVTLGSDYIYSGDFPTIGDGNELIQVLDLSHYWRLTDLHKMVQDQLTQHVTIKSFVMIRDHAILVEAQTLKEFCDVFERDNSEVISKLQNVETDQD